MVLKRFIFIINLFTAFMISYNSSEAKFGVIIKKQYTISCELTCINLEFKTRENNIGAGSILKQRKR